MPYFHDINPIALSIGPVAVHWYGIMYLLAFVGAWYLGNWRREHGRLAASSSVAVSATCCSTRLSTG